MYVILRSGYNLNSIAWTRIYLTREEEPSQEAGLKFYDNLFNELLKKDIQPLITICYYELPYHLVENSF